MLNSFGLVKKERIIVAELSPVFRFFIGYAPLVPHAI